MDGMEKVEKTDGTDVKTKQRNTHSKGQMKPYR